MEDKYHYNLPLVSEVITAICDRCLGEGEEVKVYNGQSSSKFCDGDTVFSRITPCLENRKIAKVAIEGDAAFGSCYSLKDIVLPSNIMFIGECAFLACENLNSIILPTGIT